jgi:hypothetical protein
VNFGRKKTHQYTVEQGANHEHSSTRLLLEWGVYFTKEDHQAFIVAIDHGLVGNLQD